MFHVIPNQNYKQLLLQFPDSSRLRQRYSSLLYDQHLTVLGMYLMINFQVVWNSATYQPATGVFLDLRLSLTQRGDGHWSVDHQIYFKPESSRALLDRSSFHPPQTFVAILISQLKRYRRRCSRSADYEEAVLSLFRTLARSRRYSILFLREVRTRVESRLSEDPPDVQLARRIPIVLPWHPRMAPVAKAIQREYHNFYHLLPSSLAGQFPKRLTMTWTTGKPFKRLLS